MNSQKKELTKRGLIFGANSFLIVAVVLGILGVLNYLGKQYPYKLDLTKNKIHTFSDQSEKVLKNLKGEVTATFYTNFGGREQYRPLFDNYKRITPNFKLETVDPDKEPLRAKQAGIRLMNTLVLSYQGKVAKVTDITEEKITNELIKITKDQQWIVCPTLGHGESSFLKQTADGFSAAKKGLEDQSYVVNEITLPQETKIPGTCSVVVTLGANKAFFPAEVKMLEDYLDAGGRWVVGLDAVYQGQDLTTELQGLLKKWGIEVKSGLMIDPVSRMLGVDASMPIIAQFNNDVAITKDFQQQCFFPFTRPIGLTAPAPTGIKTNWFAKTTPKAWAEADLKSLAAGQVTFNPGVDSQGPLDVAAIAQGRKEGSTAGRETRIAVFGSSQFPSNQFSRYGANLDLFLNAVSWAVEDESLISIRSKEDETGKIELTQGEGFWIFMFSVVIIPIVIAIAGIVIWIRRKRL